MLGHPTGLPLKFTSNGSLISVKEDCFESKLDAFAGNSGSAVFDHISGEVIGILCKGQKDYELTDNYKNTGTSRIQTYYVKNWGGYESCQRIDRIAVIQSLFLANGLNIEAHCTHIECSMHEEKIFVQKGFGSFTLEKEVVKQLCNECDHKLKASYSIFLQHCTYSCEGDKHERKNEQVTGYLKLNLSGASYCTINVLENN
jgi:hypothetical protein